jgi:hypothetical protein
VYIAVDYYNLFNADANRAVFKASEICQQHNNRYLEPEHVLASILELKMCTAIKVLGLLETNLPKLIYSTETYIKKHAGKHKGTPQFSSRMINLLDAAFKESKHLGHRKIGTVSLLIALVEQKGPLIKELRLEHKLDTQRIRSVLPVVMETTARRARLGGDPSTGAQVYGPFNMLHALGIDQGKVSLTMPAAEMIGYSGVFAGMFGAAELLPEHLLYVYLHMWQPLLVRGPEVLRPAWEGLAAGLYSSFARQSSSGWHVPRTGERMAALLEAAQQSAAASGRERTSRWELLEALFLSADPVLKALHKRHLPLEPAQVLALLENEPDAGETAGVRCPNPPPGPEPLAAGETMDGD